MAGRKETRPPVALGLASLVLGSFAAALCLLPILGISFAFWGFVIGAVGLVRGLRTEKPDLRWALVGTLLCAAVVGIELIVAYTAINRSQIRASEAAIGVPVGSPYTSPPARPER